MISRRRVLETMAAALAAARPWGAAAGPAAEQAPQARRRRRSPGRAGALSPPLLAAEVQEPDGQEPRVPIERRRTLRQLRRVGQPGADQLGGQVRPRRRRRRHLVVRAGRDARPHHAQLRHDRSRRHGSVLEAARRAGAWRERLQVHPAVEPWRPPARRAGDRVRQGVELDRQQGPAARIRVRADDRRSNPGRRQGVRPGRAPRARGRERTASSCTARTATSSRSSSARPSTTARTTTAASSRTARASCSRSCAPFAPRSAATSTCR